MDYYLPIFKTVSVMFAISAVFTGAKAILNPIDFAKSFGIPLTTESTTSNSYVSLLGVRQLATGVILLTFAYQNKWAEVATILAIIGILVAGTDGFYLARAGEMGRGRFHAIPGAIIAALAGGVIYYQKKA